MDRPPNMAGGSVLKREGPISTLDEIFEYFYSFVNFKKNMAGSPCKTASSHMQFIWGRYFCNNPIRVVINFRFSDSHSHDMLYKKF